MQAEGLGAVIAKQFGAKGYRIVVNYFKSEEKALQIVAEIGSERAIAIKADVRDKQQVEAMIQKAVKQFEGTIQSALNVIQAVLPEMKKVHDGRIINIGTNLFQNPVVSYHKYTTAKAALIGFTRNMAKELGAYGVTVNMVSGGLLQKTNTRAVTTPEVFDLIAASSALKRVTEPADLAEAVVFMGTEASRGGTGQNIVVDSGLAMN